MLEEMISFAPGGSADPALSPALCNGRQVAGAAEVEWIDHFKLSDTFLRFMDDAYRARQSPANARPLNPRYVFPLEMPLSAEGLLAYGPS